MAINTASSPTGVNVNIAGAVQIEGSEGDKLPECNTNLAGTFDMKEGCFYFCEGVFWQSLNAAFNEAALGEQQCDHAKRCDFDGIPLRP
jgi:hypothetical protein